MKDFLKRSDGFFLFMAMTSFFVMIAAAGAMKNLATISALSSIAFLSLFQISLHLQSEE